MHTRRALRKKYQQKQPKYELRLAAWFLFSEAKKPVFNLTNIAVRIITLVFTRMERQIKMKEICQEWSLERVIEVQKLLLIVAKTHEYRLSYTRQDVALLVD